MLCISIHTVSEDDDCIRTHACCTALMRPNQAETVLSAVPHSLVPHDYSVVHIRVQWLNKLYVHCTTSVYMYAILLLLYIHVLYMYIHHWTMEFYNWVQCALQVYTVVIT